MMTGLLGHRKLDLRSDAIRHDESYGTETSRRILLDRDALIGVEHDRSDGCRSLGLAVVGVYMC